MTTPPIALMDPRPARKPAAGIRRPRRGLAALRGVQGFRRAVQLAVTAVIGVLIVNRAAAAMSGPGVTSPEALCPFGGLETFYTWATSGGYVPHVHAANLVLAGAVLVLAFVARGAFCGWLCPLGFLQDVSAGLSAFVQRHLPAAHRGMRSLRRAAAPLAILDRPLRLLKYAVLAWALWGAAVFGFMVFRDVDPWIALLDIGRESAGFGMVILVLTLVGALFVDRPWCRYACPLGAANGIVARFSPVRLERSADACVDCNLCTRSCPMGLEIAKAKVVTSADCIGCLECVEACPRDAALQLHVGSPIANPFGGKA